MNSVQMGATKGCGTRRTGAWKRPERVLVQGRVWPVVPGASMAIMALTALTALLAPQGHGGETLPVDAALQARIDEKREVVQAWAREPVVVDYVRAHNAAGGGSKSGITQEKWKTLSVLDPVVRAFSRNPAALFLRERKTDVISEAFISGADGTKVAFLAKPSNWNHQGKPKHDLPMSGKMWQGLVEMDESTGLRQVQISVPVLDGGVSIGSLVVGLSVTKLERAP